MSEDIWIEGLIVEFENKNPCYQALIRRSGESEVIVLDIEGGETHHLCRKELESRRGSGELRVLVEQRNLGNLTLEDTTEKEQIEVHRKLKYIDMLQEAGVQSVTKNRAKTLIDELAVELGEKAPHWQSVRNWHTAYLESGGLVSALYPKHRLKGSREPKIDDRIVKIINEEAETYFNQSQPTMMTVYDEIEVRIKEHNIKNPTDFLKKPSYLTVSNRVHNSKSYRDTRRSRKGKNTFELEMADGSVPFKTTRALQRVEIDHHKVKLHVLDDNNNGLIGRPWLTALMDYHTSMVLGISLSFESPSFASASMACQHAIFPKDDYVTEDGLVLPWPAHGRPRRLVTDNGKEFWSGNFENLTADLRIRQQYAPIRRPNYKGRLERLFRTITLQLLNGMEGVVKREGKHGDSYDARKAAKSTFSDFEDKLLMWILGDFHNRPVPGGIMTPNELWAESENALPIPAEDKKTMAPKFMGTSERKLFSHGVNEFGLKYNSKALREIYRRDGGERFKVKYNPFDIGHVLVLDPKNGVYIRAEYEDQEYAAGLSRHAHKQINAVRRDLRKLKMETNPTRQQVKAKLVADRKEKREKNLRRKNQVTTERDARVDQVGVKQGLSLAVDNTKKLDRKEKLIASKDLNLDGFGVD